MEADPLGVAIERMRPVHPRLTMFRVASCRSGQLDPRTMRDRLTPLVSARSRRLVARATDAITIETRAIGRSSAGQNRPNTMTLWLVIPTSSDAVVARSGWRDVASR